MSSFADQENGILVLGGGLAGLSAGYVLSKAGFRVKVFEHDSTVGGLSKTMVQGEFRFDLGGHRFFTSDRKVSDFVEKLMKGELLSVSRKSKIYLRNRYFDYPLKPLNALFGLGIPTTCRIMTDYGIEKVKSFVKEKEPVSLEDWVVGNFGRKMFDIYFKEYSEKVWGIDCSKISAEWVDQRIQGLSLSKAVKNAFFTFSGKNLPTLADRFLYPQLGIGRISDRLKEGIEEGSDVFTCTSVERIYHSDFTIDGVAVRDHRGSRKIGGKEFVSSLPVTKVLDMLHPAPPENVRKAAAKLKFRDLVIVAVMVDKRRVTDQTWIYLPGREVPFGRIHEPTNWSDRMAPEGKTILVVEFFCFMDDSIWRQTDGRLSDLAVRNLESLGFFQRHEVIDSAVVRVPKAYPLFEVGYRKPCEEIYDYLGMFRNLHCAGRSGMFRYYNMDHAIESGMTTAERIIQQKAHKDQ